jgi:hypothetical protein
VASLITCTNGGTSTQTVAVHFILKTGSETLSPLSLSVDPNKTVVFGTKDIFGFGVDANSGLGSLASTHARIYASSRGIVCSALLAKGSDGTPLASLPVVKAYKQKGD